MRPCSDASLECRCTSCDIRPVECITVMRRCYHNGTVRKIIGPFAEFRSHLCAPIVRRDGIVVSIPRNRNRCAVTYRRVRQHVRSTPYFMARATDRVSAAAACAGAAAAAVTTAAGCTPPLEYVIYRPVKGSVKISVAGCGSFPPCRVFAR